MSIYKYLSILLLMNFSTFCSNTCKLEIYLDGGWSPGWTIIMTIYIQKCNYKTFDDFIKALNDSYRGEEDWGESFLKDAKSGNSLWISRDYSCKNLKNFIQHKCTLYEFLKNKAVTKFYKWTFVPKIRESGEEYTDSIEDETISFDLSKIDEANITFQDSNEDPITLKDMYQIKKESKEAVTKLTSLINTYKYPDLWSSEFIKRAKLGDIFHYERGRITIKNGYKDTSIPRPADYKDIVIKSGGQLSSNTIDTENNTNNDQNNNQAGDIKGSSDDLCCCCQ